jgi:HPt (histidine-containing phosphotransfer) domain-containing protein
MDAILREFLLDMQKTMRELHSTATAGNPDIIARLVHTLKGASASVGVRSLQQAAVELEKRCLAQGGRDLDHPIARVDAELQRLKAHIESAVPGEEQAE